VRYLTEATGRATDTFDYDAFGSVIARSGATPATRLFTGEEFDADLGLYNLRARYQNPGTGRFWTRDSFEGYPGNPASQQPRANFRSAFSAAEARPASGFAAIRVRAFPFFR
jgi:RHS repeat-associated protein